MAHVPVAGSLAALLALSAVPAEATLGEQLESASSPLPLERPTFTGHPRTLASGTRVVEYADIQGTVFAVTWSGPYLPDLRQLLGRHFASFIRHQQQQTALHAAVVLRTSDVVILSSGQMGAFSGRAWLPGRIPEGFDAGALR